jgi:hypothetical protein
VRDFLNAVGEFILIIGGTSLVIVIAVLAFAFWSQRGGGQ